MDATLAVPPALRSAPRRALPLPVLVAEPEQGSPADNVPFGVVWLLELEPWASVHRERPVAVDDSIQHKMVLTAPATRFTRCLLAGGRQAAICRWMLPRMS
jgi:hypothetical protein